MFFCPVCHIVSFFLPVLAFSFILLCSFPTFVLLFVCIIYNVIRVLLCFILLCGCHFVCFMCFAHNNNNNEYAYSTGWELGCWRKGLFVHPARSQLMDLGTIRSAVEIMVKGLIGKTPSRMSCSQPPSLLL